jgi:hypothetical protein
LTPLEYLEDLYQIEDRLPARGDRIDATFCIGCCLTSEGRCSSQTASIAREGFEQFKRGGKKLVLLGDGYRSKHHSTEAEQMRGLLRSELHELQNHVITVPRSSDTHENALEIAKLCKKNRWRSIMIVAEPLHARRVVATVKRAAPGVSIFIKKAPTAPYGDSDKWQLKSRLRFLLWEIACLAYFKLRGWV